MGGWVSGRVGGEKQGELEGRRERKSRRIGGKRIGGVGRRRGEELEVGSEREDHCTCF